MHENHEENRIGEHSYEEVRIFSAQQTRPGYTRAHDTVSRSAFSFKE